MVDLTLILIKKPTEEEVAALVERHGGVWTPGSVACGVIES